MGLFNFRKKRSKQSEDSKELVLQLGSYGGLVPTYTATGWDFEKSEAGMSCLQTNAQFCSKVELASVRILSDGECIGDYPALDRLLQFSPNPLNTAAVFWERTAYFYFKYNNAFIYIERDPFRNIIALWSIDPSMVKFEKVVTGEIILQFTLNGKLLEVLYSDIIHIARHVTKDVMFGDSKANTPISRVIDLINLNYTGIERAILTSQTVRFIGKVNTKMNSTELKRRAKKFTEDYLHIKSEDPVGIAYTDSIVDLVPVNSSPQKTANYAETNQWNQAVYKFFGCPEKVIAGEATEDEMGSYYERTIEPFFMRAAQEMTRKLFTDREFEVGNRIVYNDKKILYMSMKTRLEIFRTAREVGCFTLGTLGDLIGLPVPKGKRNTVVTSQNYNDSLKEEEPKKGEEEDEKDDDGKKNEPEDGNSKVEEEENNAE